MLETVRKRWFEIIDRGLTASTPIMMVGIENTTALKRII